MLRLPSGAKILFIELRHAYIHNTKSAEKAAHLNIAAKEAVDRNEKNHIQKSVIYTISKSTFTYWSALRVQ